LGGRHKLHGDGQRRRGDGQLDRLDPHHWQRCLGHDGGGAVTATTTAGTVSGTSQTTCAANFWTGTAYTHGIVSNAPTTCEQVGLNSPVSIAVRFASAIDSLYLGRMGKGADSIGPLRFPGAPYFAVGMTNSAPLAMLSGQRCITLFCLV